MSIEKNNEYPEIRPPYTTPELRVYGNIARLTQGTGSMSPNADGMSANKTS
jgi:hypothetical protein